MCGAFSVALSRENLKYRCSCYFRTNRPRTVVFSETGKNKHLFTLEREPRTGQGSVLILSNLLRSGIKYRTMGYLVKEMLSKAAVSPKSPPWHG